MIEQAKGCWKLEGGGTIACGLLNNRKKKFVKDFLDIGTRLCKKASHPLKEGSEGAGVLYLLLWKTKD